VEGMFMVGFSVPSDESLGYCRTTLRVEILANRVGQQERDFPE
jgi:hypothetical protein